MFLEKKPKEHIIKQKLLEELEDILLQLNGLEENQIKSPQDRFMIDVNMNGELMIMEVDTGAAVTVVSENVLRVQTQKTNKVLKSATGQVLELVRQVKVKALLRGKTKDLTIFVAKGNCPSLFGRDWIRAFFGDNWFETLKQQPVNAVHEQNTSERLK